jgi:D-tyrosyl-tRNA(Tyr) deacylase
VDGAVKGAISRGLVVFLCIEKGDIESAAEQYAHKVAGLRIFPDNAGKMNLSVKGIDGAVLLISQFTLAGDVEKGMRPSFMDAASPEEADRLYLYFVECLRSEGVAVETGVFQAMMKVALINDGPVTILLGGRTLERGLPGRKT